MEEETRAAFWESRWSAVPTCTKECYSTAIYKVSQRQRILLTLLEEALRERQRVAKEWGGAKTQLGAP